MVKAAEYRENRTGVLNTKYNSKGISVDKNGKASIDSVGGKKLNDKDRAAVSQALANGKVSDADAAALNAKTGLNMSTKDLKKLQKDWEKCQKDVAHVNRKTERKEKREAEKAERQKQKDAERAEKNKEKEAKKKQQVDEKYKGQGFSGGADNNFRIDSVRGEAIDESQSAQIGEVIHKYQSGQSNAKERVSDDDAKKLNEISGQNRTPGWWTGFYKKWIAYLNEINKIENAYKDENEDKPNEIATA